ADRPAPAVLRADPCGAAAQARHPAAGRGPRRAPGRRRRHGGVGPRPRPGRGMTAAPRQLSADELADAPAAWPVAEHTELAAGHVFAMVRDTVRTPHDD